LRRQVGDRFDLSGPDLRQRDRALHHQQVDLAGDQIGHGRPCAAIGNELDLLTGQLLE
jgi:hypothetical protein